MKCMFLLALIVASASAAGGDFEFKCETTCQLVQKSEAPASKASFLEISESSLVPTTQTLPAQPTSGTSTGVNAAPQTECYSLCLNPTVNLGCNTAATHASFLQHEVFTGEQLMGQLNLSSGSDCLDSCVRVCLAVKEAL